MLTCFHNRQQQQTTDYNNNNNREQSDPYVSFLLRQATQKLGVANIAIPVVDFTNFIMHRKDIAGLN